MEYHEIANCFPLIQGTDFLDLVEDVRKHGLLQAILTFEGKILDGRNRFRACEVAGVQPRFVAFQGTWEEARATVVSLNLQRRNLTEAEKAIAAKRVANLKHGSNRFEAKVESAIDDSTKPVTRREACEMMGVSEAAFDRASVVVDHGVPELVEAVGRETVPMSTGSEIARAIPAVQPVLMAAGVTAKEARAIAQETSEVQAAIVAAPNPVEAAREAARPHVANNSGNNEWYTPPDLIERARRVMGGIDLDPASSLVANRTVKAEKIYTAENSGLDLPWYAKSVWMNPPYSSEWIGKFATKIVEEVKAGRVKQAITLTNNATDTGWFAEMANAATGMCTLRGRVRFMDPQGNPSGAPLQGQVLLYFGDDFEAFKREFSQLGRVWK
jgi:ParB-like chromosome segregation protein Spo0J